MWATLASTIGRVAREARTVFRKSPWHWLALVTTATLAALLTLYPATRISFELRGDGVYQVFHDDGVGFSEARSGWRNSGPVDLTGGLAARAFRVDPPADSFFSVCAPVRSLRWLPGIGGRMGFAPEPVASLGVQPAPGAPGCASWDVEAGHPDPQVVFAVPPAFGGSTLAKALTIARYFLWTLAFFAAAGAAGRMGAGDRQRIARCSYTIYGWLDRRLAHLFLVLGLAIGVAFIAIRPPGAVPDEFAHASKIALMAAGQLVGADEGRERPNLLDNYGPFQEVYGRKFSPAELEAVVTAPLACADTARKGVAAPAGASPLMYLSPWAGHTLTCRLDGGFGLYYYGSQLVNLFLFLFLGFIGLKWAGFGRWPLFVIASLPMSLYLATSLSYDANMLALCIAYLGVVSGAWSRRISIVRAQWALLGLGLLLALSKPLMGWIFFAPWICFAVVRGGWLIRLRWLLLSSLLPAAVHASWIFRLSRGSDGYVRPDVESVNGMEALIASPLSYLQMIASTAFSNTGAVILKGVVGVFGWLDTYPPNYFYSTAALAIFGSLALNSQAKPSGLKAGVFAWSIAIMVIAIMCIPFYAYWTQPQSPVIEGLQGRYFIPLLAFVAMFCSFSVPIALRGVAAALVIVSIPVMSAIALTSIISRYY
ncbi:DUF2142 domain-containing protein [Luteimonas aestuarii]|nr:DUF2142 domain-containing protein [Luteimonas aestuarii]